MRIRKRYRTPTFPEVLKRLKNMDGSKKMEIALELTEAERIILQKYGLYYTKSDEEIVTEL